MDRELLDILACPGCKGPLEVEVVEEDEQGIYVGSLLCARCSKTYPIVHGVPNFLPEGTSASDFIDNEIPVTGRSASRSVESPQALNRSGPGFVSFKPLVFISHSSQDKDTAIALATDLRSRGLSVWIDHERIKFGESISAAIELGLSQSKCIIVLISPSFVSSNWCRAEYEPLLKREIESGNTLVLPILIDDCELPPLLSSKRYVDLRPSSGVSRSRQLDELSSQILASAYDPSTLPSSKLVDTLRHTLTSLTPETLLQAKNVQDNRETGRLLLNEVSSLIDRFEEYIDEIASVLAESKISTHFYGSAHAIEKERILRANRKLITLSNEMRSVYRQLDKRFAFSPEAKDLIESIMHTCAQIGIAEDFLIIDLLSNAEVEQLLPDETLERFRGAHRPMQPDNLQHPFYPGEMGPRMVRDYHLALIELNNYRIALKEAVEDLERLG